MVKLECLEKIKGCEYMTQNLPFAEAEKILEKHLDICSFVHHKPIEIKKSAPGLSFVYHKPIENERKSTPGALYSLP